MVLEWLERLHDVRRNPAQIAPLRAGIHIDDRLHVVMVDHGGTRHRRELRQIAEHLRGLGTRGVHRRVHQVLQRRHAVLRRLYGDGIGNAVLWIQPEIGGRLEASAQADQHALCDFLGIQSDLIDARAVHIEVKSGQAHHLLHVHVRRAGNLAQPICDSLRDVVVPAHIGAHYLNIDRRGQSKIENLRHDIGGLEEELHARKPRWKFAAQLAHVLRRRMMVFRIQRNQNLRIARPNHARTGCRKD